MKESSVQTYRDTRVERVFSKLLKISIYFQYFFLVDSSPRFLFNIWVWWVLFDGPWSCLVFAQVESPIYKSWYKICLISVKRVVWEALELNRIKNSPFCSNGEQTQPIFICLVSKISIGCGYSLLKLRIEMSVIKGVYFTVRGLTN